MFDATPEHWREASFSLLADYANGRAFKPEDWGKSGLPIIRIAQITKPGTETDFFDGSVEPRHQIDDGDLIFSWSATLAVVRWSGGPAVLNQHLFKVTPAAGIDREWLQYRLEASIPDLAEEAHGTTMKHIRKGTLTSQTTLVPPLIEQRRIAEVLRSASEAVTATEAVISNAASVRQCTLDTLMGNLIDAAGDELPVLSEAAEIRTGLAKNKNADGRHVRLPYLRVANVQDGWFDLSDMQEIDVEPEKVERYSLRAGDVLLTEGGDYDKLGRGGVWKGQVHPCLHQNHVFSVRSNPARLLPEYLALVTQSFLGRSYFLSCAKRTTNLASINSSQLKALPLPLPDVERQSAVVAEIGCVDAVIEREEEKLGSLLRLRASLQSDLLSGRVRVPA